MGKNAQQFVSNAQAHVPLKLLNLPQIIRFIIFEKQGTWTIRSAHVGHPAHKSIYYTQKKKNNVDAGCHLAATAHNTGVAARSSPTRRPLVHSCRVLHLPPYTEGRVYQRPVMRLTPAVRHREVV